MINVSAKLYSLNQLYFYLTEGCNLHCRHCWIVPKYQNEAGSYPMLDISLFRSILQQARPLGLKGVKLTGGEPLLHPQIYEILEEIRVNELQLTIETNGILCTGDLARKIAMAKNAFVSVSLDGVNAQTHDWIRGVSGCFEQVLRGVRNLVKAGLKPQIIMTIMRRNQDQIEHLLHLAESMGAGSIKFNLVQPIAKGKQMHEKGQTLTIEELVNLGRWVENTLSVSTSLPLFFSHPLAFRPLGRMFGNHGDGCITCGILGILGVLANGSYALCGIGEVVPELVFGHAASDSLKDIWHSTPLLQEIREGLPGYLEGICGECLMKSHCLGACVAQNYYCHKNIWQPFWFCEQAYRRGLFPESRISSRTLS